MKTKILLGLSMVYLLASVGCKKDEPTPHQKQTPKLTIMAPASIIAGTAVPVTLSSSAGTKAGGAISYAINPAALATVDATGKITAISAGTVTLTVNSAGDANYNSSTASKVITITPAVPGKTAQTLGVKDAANTGLLDTDMDEGDKLTAFVSGFDPAGSFTVTSDNASVTVTIVDARTGEIEINATLGSAGNVVNLTFDAPGSATHHAATPLVHTITVSAAAAVAAPTAPTAGFAVDFVDIGRKFKTSKLLKDHGVPYLQVTNNTAILGVGGAADRFVVIVDDAVAAKGGATTVYSFSNSAGLNLGNLTTLGPHHKVPKGSGNFTIAVFAIKNAAGTVYASQNIATFIAAHNADIQAQFFINLNR